MKMRVGIAIDDWKRSCFEEALKDASFEYKIDPGVTTDTLMVYVVVNQREMPRLERVVRAANQRAREEKN